MTFKSKTAPTILAIFANGKPDERARLAADIKRNLREIPGAETCQLDELHLPDMHIRDCEGLLQCTATGRCGIKNDEGEKLWVEIVQHEIIILLAPDGAFLPEWKRVWERMAPRAMYNYLWHDKILLGLGQNRGEIKKALIMMGRGFFRSNIIAGAYSVNTNLEKPLRKLMKIYSGAARGMRPGWGLKTLIKPLLQKAIFKDDSFRALANYARKEFGADNSQL